MTDFLALLAAKHSELLRLFIDHMNMTTMAVFISLSIGIPVGIVITHSRLATRIVIGLANIMQSIPCIALLAFSVPFVGIGAKPAIMMVIIYALLPIIKNTYTGIMSIDPKTIEVARGMGLTKWQRMFRIELPLAAPFIMAGIRISAVAAVGTMTIAAFAGAGGLGWFINLGLNSQNVGLVLLGAIPASLMALGIDLLLGQLERAVTPEGLLPPEQIQNIPAKKRRRRQIAVFALCGLLVLLPAASALSGYLSERGERKVTVASGDFTEAMILGYMYSELIKANSDIKVEERFNLGGAVVCFNALKKGDVDMFVEYTGSILPNYFHMEFASTDPQAVYEKSKELLMKEHGIAVSKPLGFNNTYVMGVRPETAKRYGIRTLSEMMGVADKLRLGCTVGFVQRGDCLPLMKKRFKKDFKSVTGLQESIRYRGLAAQEVDVIDAFSTDAQLTKQKVTLKEDDINFFPPYYAVNLVRQDTFEKYPELEGLLSKMDGLLNEDTMRALNAKVDIGGQDARTVAREFLLEKGLIAK